MRSKYYQRVEDVLTMLTALSDPTRFAVFECVRGCGGQSVYDTVTGQCDAGSPGSVAACRVRCYVPCSPSSLSRHVSALRDAGLVTTERIGRELYVKVVPAALERLARHFADARSCCAAGTVAHEGALSAG